MENLSLQKGKCSAFQSSLIFVIVESFVWQVKMKLSIRLLLFATTVLSSVKASSVADATMTADRKDVELTNETSLDEYLRFVPLKEKKDLSLNVSNWMNENRSNNDDVNIKEVSNTGLRVVHDNNISKRLASQLFTCCSCPSLPNCSLKKGADWDVTGH